MVSLRLELVRRFVALRKESVDRNPGFAKFAYGRINVALRKESVDRNNPYQYIVSCNYLSLSARRAWIEIPAGCWRDARRAVALRKESVDRNTTADCPSITVLVALRKESVDRNQRTV